MKVIQRELSDMNGGAEDDVAELEKRLAEADLPEHVRKKQKQSFVNSKLCNLRQAKRLWYVTI
jgi:ATP-dependent Lon protease